jgi:hypothetical protein
MVEGGRAKIVFEYWLKHWSICSLDVKGQSRGSLTSWIPTFRSLSESSHNSIILVQLEALNLGIKLLVLNIYGPYID